MKQLGNLAIVCAKRPDVTFLMERGQIKVVAYHRGGYQTMIANWDDDARIEEMDHQLNFGRYAEKAA